MEEKKKFNYKDIIIVILGILFVILVVLTIIKFKKSDLEEIASNYNTYDISDCAKGKCSKEFKLGDNVLNIDKNSDESYEIKYNDYVIFSAIDVPYIGNNIYTFNDSLLFTTHDENDNLTLYRYDIGNAEATKIELPEDYWFIKKIDVNNEKVTISTTRFIKGDSFLDEANEAYVDITSCFDFREFEERRAEQIFEFTYLENEISPIKGIAVKNLSELSKYSNLCK